MDDYSGERNVDSRLNKMDRNLNYIYINMTYTRKHRLKKVGCMNNQIRYNTYSRQTKTIHRHKVTYLPGIK